MPFREPLQVVLLLLTLTSCCLAQVEPTAWLVQEGAWSEVENWSKGIPNSRIPAIIGQGTALVTPNDKPPAAAQLTLGQATQKGTAQAKLVVHGHNLQLNGPLIVGSSNNGSLDGSLSVEGDGRIGGNVSLIDLAEVGIVDSKGQLGRASVSVVGSLTAAGKGPKLSVGVNRSQVGLADGTLQVTGDLLGFADIVVGQGSGGAAIGRLEVRNGTIVSDTLQIGSLSDASSTSTGSVLLESTKSDIRVLSLGALGELEGNNLTVGSVVNAGLWTPGNIRGARTVGERYDQTPTGTIAFEIAGSEVARQYDTLRVDGSATLAGTLAVRFLPEFKPQVGLAFDLIEAGKLAGSFDRFEFDDVPTGLAIELIESPSRISLRLQEPKPLSYLQPAGAKLGWASAENWAGGLSPTSLHVVELANAHGSPQQMQVGSNVVVQSLLLRGGTAPMQLRLDPGVQFGATHDISLGRGGSVQLGKDAAIHASSLKVAPGANLATGEGSVLADLVNGGKITLGGESPTSVLFEGDFLQLDTGVLEFDFAGQLPGGFDTLTVLGQANLGGLLSINLGDLSDIKPGQDFTLMTATDGILGDFSFVQLSGVALPPGIGFGFNTTDTHVVMYSFQTLLGNMDLDTEGMVNACDIDDFALAMRDPLGYFDLHSTIPATNGDMNQDFQFDFDDIEMFLAAVGDSPCETAFAAVPEPSSLSLLWFALAALVWRRRAREN